MPLIHKFVKRIFDVFLSLIGIISLVPLFIFLYILLKISLKGPLFFFQKRVGLYGRLFICIKFRTMYIDSEKQGSITTAHDSRITSIGHFMRKYKLDELPQLWNVFIGKMSFVGPRPDVEGYADKLEGNARQILELRPGITGPASIYFHNEGELLSSVENPKEYNDTVIWPKKIMINLIYIDNWSFWKDIGYILITIIPQLDKFFGLMKEFNDIKLNDKGLE